MAKTIENNINMEILTPIGPKIIITAEMSGEKKSIEVFVDSLSNKNIKELENAYYAVMKSLQHALHHD